MSVIAVGTVFVDIKGYPIGAYNPRGRNAGRMQQVHGGVGRNIAEDLGNIGVPVRFVSLVDHSGAASDVLARLEEHGVETGFVRRTPDGMGTWLAVFNDGNDVAAEVSIRPNLLPIADILRERGDELFGNAGSVLLELDMDPEIVRGIYALGKKHGVPVYAAVANMDEAIRNRGFLPETDCFVCNEEEASILFGEAYKSMDTRCICDSVAENARNAGIADMVVTLGSRGAVYADRNGNRGYVPATKVPVADTTGAGDAFFAGVSAGLTYGKTLEEACAIGTRLAASVISRSENTCPKFLPAEFGLTVDKE